MRKRIIILGGLLAAVGGLAFASTRLADITPDEVAGGVADDRAARGRALLEALAQTHGEAVWHAHRTLHFEGTDEWLGTMGSLNNPFHVPKQALRGIIATSEWTASFELANGPDQGTRWGIVRNEVYVQRPDRPIESPPAEDLSPMIPASFLVPTLRYFVMLPLEIPSAAIVAALEPVQEDGRTFDRVYATWGSVEANPRYDQYILWIDHATGRLDRVEYTVREIMAGARGIARYEAYDEVDGALVPTRIRIHAVLPTGHPTPLHTMTFTGPRFEDEAARAP
ncbi:MAG: hypothetical protein KC933_29320 [Myxococcales bacterium]|nr:hypothetical protein [Myxococcales bacterium]MCB9648853.1 hypothetical protein [Deltaproteobacteria bacterium]